MPTGRMNAPRCSCRDAVMAAPDPRFGYHRLNCECRSPRRQADQRIEIGRPTMKMRIAATMALLATAALWTPTATAQAANDEAKIRALEARFADAFNAKDADSIMKVYVPDASLVVFDVVPPRQYVGAH